ncbi:hypothetical protein MPLSOD_40775 [Mesorhizobium sp. SOD10]|nr:hypothetical protein MPLSOD_40775 [Mesorhizobium sp. SOD10]
MNHPIGTRADLDEVRTRILEVVEERFRRIGYHRTSRPCQLVSCSLENLLAIVWNTLGSLAGSSTAPQNEHRMFNRACLGTNYARLRCGRWSAEREG